MCGLINLGVRGISRRLLNHYKIRALLYSFSSRAMDIEKILDTSTRPFTRRNLRRILQAFAFASLDCLLRDHDQIQVHSLVQRQ